MPIYEYRCADCDRRFERMVRGFATDQIDANGSCPECSSKDVVRLISRVAFHGGGNIGIGRAAYPTAWDQTNGGDAKTVKYWQSRVEREQREEAKHPELVSLRHDQAMSKWSAGVTSASHLHEQTPDAAHGHSHTQSESVE